MNHTKSLIAAVLILICAVLTFQRNQLWADPRAMWEDITTKSPDKPRAWFGLANVYMKAYAQTKNDDDRNRAMAALFKTDAAAQKRLDQNIIIPAETDIALLMIHAGDYDQAYRILTGVLQAAPGYAEAWEILALLHAKGGNPQESIFITDQLLEKDSNWRARASIYATRAEAFCRLGDAIQADRSYERARELDRALPAGRCESKEG